MRRRDALASAALAGVMVAGSSMSALLQQVDSFDEIRGPAWAVVALGAVVQIAKDLQTYYSPNRPKDSQP